MLDPIRCNLGDRLPYIVLNIDRHEGRQLLCRFRDHREAIGLVERREDSGEAFVYPAAGVGEGMARKIVREAIQAQDAAPGAVVRNLYAESFSGLKFATKELSPSGQTMVLGVG